MTTYRAVAATTAAFAQRIRQAIRPFPGAIVTTERPTAPTVAGQPRVNLFLYHVDANPFLTTNDLPTRRVDGSLMEKPRIALDLYYLLSFYGDDKKPAPESHVLLGLTMSGIHARPLLSPQELGVLDGEPVGGDFVALTPLPLSIHELSRLWSMFFQTPYTISVSLKASAAVLIADLPAGEAPPVERTGLEVVLFTEPAVTTVGGPATGPNGIAYGGELLVVGSGFGGDGVQLAIGPMVLPLPPGAASGGRILVALDAPELRAGAQPLQVVTAAGFRSPPVGILLRPQLRGVSLNGGVVTAQAAPDVRPEQTAHVLLNLTTAAPPGAQTEFTLDVSSESTPSALSASTAGVPPGVYTVRVRIDGADSLPGLDPLTNRHDQPTIAVPPASAAP